MEEQKISKKTYILIIIGVIVAILLTLGVTYAYWRLTREQTDANVITTDCFNIAFTGTGDITLNKAYPMSDTELDSFLSTATPYHFTITNNCTSQASATINLESLSGGTSKQLTDEYVDAILYETTYKTKLNANTKLTSNPNNDTNKVISTALHAYKLYNFTLGASAKKDYYLLLYLDKDTPLTDATQNASWKGKITLTAEYKKTE